MKEDFQSINNYASRPTQRQDSISSEEHNSQWLI